MEFRAIASSSAGCAYHLSGGGASAPLLIEAGLPFSKVQSAVRAIGLMLTAVAGCLITHSHGDHARAALDVARAGIDVYATKETLRELPALGHRAKMIVEEEEFAVGDWRIMPFATVHDTPGAVGFLIGSPDGGRLLFMTDTAYTKHVFPGLTMLAVECNYSSEAIRESVSDGRVDRRRFSRTVSTHMSLDTLLGMLAANDLSKVEAIWLLHLSDDNSNETEFKAAVERATGIPTFVAPAMAVAA